MATSGAVPDSLVVLHNTANQLGSWVRRTESLYDGQGDPLWLEHPQHGRKVDVVALPLTQTNGVDLFPYEPANPGPPIALGPTEQVSIIGFPFGMTAGGAFGIWVQGTVASEPDVDFQGLPSLMVDSRTRSGQSGSPVIVYRPGAWQGGGALLNLGAGAAARFVGVYSGRINAQSDLGIVWKATALVAILNGQQRGPLPTVGSPP